MLKPGSAHKIQCLAADNILQLAAAVVVAAATAGAVAETVVTESRVVLYPLQDVEATEVVVVVYLLHTHKARCRPSYQRTEHID